MLSIVNATEQDVPVIQDIANKTWWPTYSPIIGREQIEYMLNAIYSDYTLKKVMKDGSQKFILLKSGEKVEGFAAYGPRIEDPAVIKLHKLYVLPENHGKGFGKLLIDEVKSRTIAAGSHKLDLNVNRFNHAIKFYEKIGFQIIKEEDVPVGPYFMNDYVMRLEL